MRETLIQFLDELREYISESGNDLSNDERESSEFVDIFLNSKKSINTKLYTENDMDNAYDKGLKDGGILDIKDSLIELL